MPVNPIEWGKFMGGNDPVSSFGEHFINSFKEGLAFRLAQKETKFKQQMGREKQKALEENEKYQRYMEGETLKLRRERETRLGKQAEDAAKGRVNKQNMDLIQLEGRLAYQDAQVKLAGGRLSLAQQALANQQNDMALNRLATDEWDSPVGSQVFNRILGATTTEELEAIEKEESQLPDFVDWTTASEYGGTITVKKPNTDAGKIGLALNIRRRQLGGWPSGAKRPGVKAPPKGKSDPLGIR